MRTFKMNAELECIAFADNYITNGGSLQYLKLEVYEDGAFSYQTDWNAIEEAGIEDFEFTNNITEHAKHVTGRLITWLECAKAKVIPEGYVLMPKEVNQELIDFEMQGKVLPAVMGSYERAVNNFKVRYKAMLEKQEEINNQAVLEKV